MTSAAGYRAVETSRRKSSEVVMLLQRAPLYPEAAQSAIYTTARFAAWFPSSA